MRMSRRMALLGGSYIKPPPPLQTFTINVSASPTEGGSVNGGGSFTQNTYRTVTATANSGFDFVRWTEDGTMVSTSPNYSLGQLMELLGKKC